MTCGKEASFDTHRIKETFVTGVKLSLGVFWDIFIFQAGVAAEVFGAEAGDGAVGEGAFELA